MNTSNAKKMIDHNSYEFHEEILNGIKPEREYVYQLRTALGAIRELGIPPEVASRSYRVGLQDITHWLKRKDLPP